jgi:hypothetical protein
MNGLLETLSQREEAVLSASERVRCEVLRRLWRGGYLALRDVGCEVRGETVRLRGTLPSHYLIQVACAIAGEVEGVGRVVSSLEVCAPPALGSFGNGLFEGHECATHLKGVWNDAGPEP